MTSPEIMREWRKPDWRTSFPENEKLKKRIEANGQNFNDLAYTCPCGDGFILRGETCQNGQKCTDCERLRDRIERRTMDNEGYFTAQCDGIRVQYLGDFTDPCVCTDNMPDDVQGYFCQKAELYRSKLDYYTWICRNEQCACGNETCHKRQSCLMGKCYDEEEREQPYTIHKCGGWIPDPYHGITHASWDSKVCLCNNMDIMKDLYSKGWPAYKCDNGTAWQCINEKGCQCGSVKIPQNSYCLAPNVCGGKC